MFICYYISELMTKIIDMPFYDKSIEFKDEKFHIANYTKMNRKEIVLYITKRLKHFILTQNRM